MKRKSVVCACQNRKKVSGKDAHDDGQSSIFQVESHHASWLSHSRCRLRQGLHCVTMPKLIYMKSTDFLTRNLSFRRIKFHCLQFWWCLQSLILVEVEVYSTRSRWRMDEVRQYFPEIDFCTRVLRTLKHSAFFWFAVTKLKVMSFVIFEFMQHPPRSWNPFYFWECRTLQDYVVALCNLFNLLERFSAKDSNSN